MVGWYHPLYGHEFEEALGVGDGQGGLGCCTGTTLTEGMEGEFSTGNTCTPMADSCQCMSKNTTKL